MSLTVKDNGKNFLPAPEGLHIARCYAVIDLGVQFNSYYHNYAPKVLMGWELPTTLLPNGKPFIHHQRYTASLTDSSHLRQLLESWRGRGFTPEELAGFHLKHVLGVTCYLSMTHHAPLKSQPIYAHVAGICPLPDGIVCPDPVNPTHYFDLDEYSDEAYHALPERIRQKIQLNSGQGSTEPTLPSRTRAADLPF